MVICAKFRLDGIYFSFTTMTTIGYGDRLPVTEQEIVFVIFAEVFGLAVFALLVKQVKMVQHTLSGTPAPFNTD